MSKLALILPCLLQGARAFILLPATGPAASGGNARMLKDLRELVGDLLADQGVVPKYRRVPGLCAPLPLHVYCIGQGTLVDIRCVDRFSRLDG